MRRLAIALFLCSFPLTVLFVAGQTNEKKEQNAALQKRTYILLTVTHQPHGLVVSSHDEINNLKDLQRVVAVMATREGELLESYPVLKNANCQCGEDCACVDCKCDKKKAAKQPALPKTFKLPRVSCDEDENEARSTTSLYEGRSPIHDHMDALLGVIEAKDEKEAERLFRKKWGEKYKTVNVTPYVGRPSPATPYYTKDDLGCYDNSPSKNNDRIPIQCDKE